MFFKAEELSALKIIPVVTPYSVEATLEMTKAMRAGGITSVEITLRTDCAFEAIEAVKTSDIDVSLGVGTVTSVEMAEKVAAMDVDFVVSPGVTTRLLDAARDYQLKLLPGISSPSQLMQAQEYGYQCFKLFPASVVNAIPMLKALGGPFPDVAFCPTGGVSLANAADHLALPNVACVGGSWMIPKVDVLAGDWDKITAASQQAMAV